MKKILLLAMSLFFITCESPTDSDTTNSSWVFVANEGNFGSSNGSISMIDEAGNVMHTESIGDVVQSLAVYENKLIVLINNSHLIKIYDITADGLSMPGIEIPTGNSSPRDLVVIDNKVYFTNWNTQDVKVLNLFNYSIENSIAINGLPEDLLFDGIDLWVTIPHSDQNFATGNTVSKIDIITNTILETIEVGNGPQELAINNGELFVSRTFYDANWNTFHGATKIGVDVINNNYGAGAACGGSIIKHNNSILRSFNGGLSLMDAELNLDTENKIGDYTQANVYHVEKINGSFWFAITNFSDINEVRVVNEQGEEIANYTVGINPGDFAVWENN